MPKQLKVMILANIILGSLLIILNMAYDFYGNSAGHAVQWAPLWLRFYNYMLPAPDVGITIPNFTFYLFWVATAVNLCFIIKLAKSRETS